MNDKDELALICRVQGGDHRAFGKLALEYERVLFNLALRMVKNREDARDLTQAVFLKVYRGIGTFDADRRFYSWIYRIMLNECLNFLKSHKPCEELEDDSAVTNSTPEDGFSRDEIGSIIQNALMQLTEQHRQVIVMRHFLQLTYAEMSEVLTIPEKTIKSRLFAARRQLGDVLRRKGVHSQ